MMRNLMAVTALLLAAACGESADEAASDADAVLPVEPDGGVDDGATLPPAQATGAPTIPAAVQGRWGLTPADCASADGAAEGLLVIGPDRLSFYESRGTLRDVSQADERGIRAVYAFTGEGMEWMRDIALNLEVGDARLVRREFGEGAPQEPLTYTRCQ